MHQAGAVGFLWRHVGHVATEVRWQPEAVGFDVAGEVAAQAVEQGGMLPQDILEEFGVGFGVELDDGRHSGG
ncbi:hypothetical protein D9M71_824780 [compost metagenome]